MTQGFMRRGSCGLPRFDAGANLANRVVTTEPRSVTEPGNGLAADLLSTEVLFQLADRPLIILRAQVTTTIYPSICLSTHTDSITRSAAAGFDGQGSVVGSGNAFQGRTRLVGRGRGLIRFAFRFQPVR
jgi:hypothetical protein